MATPSTYPLVQPFTNSPSTSSTTTNSPHATRPRPTPLHTPSSSSSTSPSPHRSSSSQYLRSRLSLFTHSTLGHDVAAALKASGPVDDAGVGRSAKAAALRDAPIEAPPPSPVDFAMWGFGRGGEPRSGSESGAC
ncbi:hypothetical protein HDK77DRAFT_483943 [Phyllosticta capitalensis]|uniref:Uncharacterized protein n=1 Tax=Phyllosticta capitalensis TaxID=121624 RepID=A0ABR1YFD4_9PEZI